MEALNRMRAEAQHTVENGKARRWQDGESRWTSGGGESRQLQPQVVFGYALTVNDRGQEMEDFHVAEIREIVQELDDGMATEEEVGLFAIFDSHQGAQVGRAVQSSLFENILGEGGIRADPAGAIRDGYLLTDRQLLEAEKLEGGCTAVTAIVMENGGRLLVANVGDSKAVLCKNGTAVQLSVDHDAGRPVERADVERRGGIVLSLPGDVPRIDGQLAVARAFGDKSLKQHMTAKPDVVDLLVDLSCEFLILASKGLWTTLSGEEAVELVNGIPDPREAAKSLVEEAWKRLNDDDVACIVIRFREK